MDNQKVEFVSKFNKSGEEKILKSVIIPTRNEEDYIEECINSLIDLSIPWDTEFIVVDGMSTDRTIEIVKEKFSHLNLKILENPNLYQSYAMNIGIENSASTSEVIIRADAHSKYLQDHIEDCYKAFSKNPIWVEYRKEIEELSGAGNCGSVQCAVGTNFFTRIVADVMNSGYAMGGVQYRKIDMKYPLEKLYIQSDTAYLGCWEKSVLIELGGFDEEFQINEDYELNIRIRRSERKVMVSKSSIVDYYVRSSIFGLIKQFFRYGLWKTKTLSVHPDSFKLRQLAPVLFVLFLITLGIGNLILPNPYLLILNASSSIIGVFWLIMILLIWKNSPNNRTFRDPKFDLIFSIFFIPFIVLSMHISWGLGFLYGLIRWAKGGWKS